MACQVVFDLADEGYRQWPFVYAGVFVSILSLVWIVNREKVRRLSWRRYPNSMPFLFSAVVITTTIFFFEQTYGPYQYLRGLELGGKVRTVSGPIYKQADIGNPSSGARREVFSVDGQEFVDSVYTLEPGYHLSSAYGSLITPGAMVRVAAVGNNILKVEVCSPP